MRLSQNEKYTLIHESFSEKILTQKKKILKIG